MNTPAHDLETAAPHVVVTLELQEAALVQGRRSQRLTLVDFLAAHTGPWE